MKQAKKFLIVILGPTASGKTAISLKLAKKFNGEIIAADSRTIYKEMDIGTAKPTKEEKQGIPHYMIDVVGPEEEFTVAQFKQKTIKIIEDIHKRGKIPFLVGGTGLYISSIVDNLNIPRVPPDKKLRKKLEKQIAKYGLDRLWKKLIKLDSPAANFVQKENPRRIIRALEVIYKTKKPFSQLRKKGQPLFNTLQIGIKMSRQVLYQRINKRVDLMIKAGLVEEVEKLLKKTPSNLSAMSGIGYHETIKYLQDQISLEETVELIKQNTRRYAHRQMTWFKRDKRIKWVKNYHQALSLIILQRAAD